jgi:hypothetical protein
MKTDWLLAVGCSLTWGSETTVVGSSLVKDHDNAWPAHLGKMLSTDTVINRGWPGRSNSSIFRVAASDMIHYANEFGSNGIIAIQWSGNARMEFINPYKIDITEYYRRVNNGNHPGQEGPYLNITPNDLGVFPSNPPILDDVCIRDYFLKYWAHEFYQQELLFTYSISLTSIATRLGIRIIQFNGIDELNPASLPSHAAPLNTLIGNEFYYPYDRSKTFWCSAHPDTLKMRPAADEVFKMPHHPTTAQHIEWANTLYDYIKTI